MTTKAIDPQRSSTAAVFAPRSGFFYGLTVVMALFPISFGVLGWQRDDNLSDLWTGLALGALFGGVMLVLTVFYGRQRVVVDRGAVWVRYLRWHGPIRLNEVVAVQAYANGHSTGLVLVQAHVGSVIGAWSAANSFGRLRRSRFREVQTQDGPLRYLYLPGFAFHTSMLRLIARPLLLRPTVMIDERSRQALADSLRPQPVADQAP